jgi:hypothetical protein
MTRQREIPSIQYRHENLVNMTFPVYPDYARLRVRGAARLADAYGAGAGVNGAGTLSMFEVEVGTTYSSPSILSRRISPIEEVNRGLTRMIWDPDDFSTPEQTGGYLPSDDKTWFLRLERFSRAANAYLPEGPIFILFPYDFFTTKEPVFTLTSIAPNLDIGAFPTHIPDFLGPGALNFQWAAYATTMSLVNLDDPTTGKPLFFSCHPGMPPSVVMPGKEVSLTGSGIPELFIASPNGNPWFTVRLALVNSA